MAPTATTLYVHRNRWDGERNDLSTGFTIWTAHRPLRGEVMWEGQNLGWGVHFAATRNESPELADHDEHNRCMDAREVRLLDNMASITLAGEMAKRANRGAYGIGAYTAAYPGAEGAKMFVETYDLPWDDYDTTADAFLAALAAS